MSSYTFDTYKSNNPRLHNRINQQQQYSRYLKRIDSIVDKKLQQDTSTYFYMTFLNKTKYISRNHQSLEQQMKIGIQNKHLLNKIYQTKNRKTNKFGPTYALAMYQKRCRQQQKINQQNKQIAKRITQQYSILKKKSQKSISKSINSSQQKSPKKNGLSWHFVKGRKLPKLTHQFRG